MIKDGNFSILSVTTNWSSHTFSFNIQTYDDLHIRYLNISIGIRLTLL